MRMTRGPLLARYRCLQIESGRGMGLVEEDWIVTSELTLG